MKRKFVFALLALLFSSILTYSQSYIGVFAGLNMRNLSGDAPSQVKYENIAGLNAGLFFDVRLSESILLGVQPSFSQEGSKIAIKVKGEYVDSVDIRLNYFSIPVILKVLTANQRFYALAGLEYSVLSNGFVKSGDIEENVAPYVIDWDMKIHFGAGIKIPIGYPQLFAELRYAQGLVNIGYVDVIDSYVPRTKNGGFSILFGIEFPLSKSNKL